MTLVSLLLPTRDRADALSWSIQHALELAQTPERVQVCYAVDPDDEATRRTVDRLARSDDVIWVAPERYGYRQLHRYVNALAERAAGAWQMLWNDDADLQTPDWDIVLAFEDQDAVLWPETDVLPDMLLFPIVPAAWVEVLGCYSPLLHSDTFWTDVAGALGRLRRVPVEIRHLPAAGSYHDPGYFGAEQQAVRDQVVARLREVLT
jgi:hypothetical protein